jgi:hypothetical protein
LMIFKPTGHLIKPMLHKDWRAYGHTWKADFIMMEGLQH